MGRLVFHINSAYAEFEREIIGERVRAGIRAKRQKNNNQWGRRALRSEIQQKIKALIAEKQAIRTIAKILSVSTRTVMKYK